ncbi:MAG: helix-turn-helix domain-containing protein [Pirellula sp.]|jgi:excisionase family DNA binding protein|nr:helix-turn-helix domain-containing protein [Pirellula sp.]
MEKHFLTAPNVAKILGIGAEQVLSYIARGELRAINTSLGDRPRWKIDPEDLDKFCESRSNAPKTAKPSRRRELPTAKKDYV